MWFLYGSPGVIISLYCCAADTDVFDMHNMTEIAQCLSIIKSVPDLYLILSPDLKIIEASDRYLQQTMRTREAVIGKYVFDIFPSTPGSQSNLFKESMEKAVATKQQDTVTGKKYDIKKDDGSFEERYWNALNTPVLDENNNVLYLIHRAEDVTEFMHLRCGTKKLEARNHELEDLTNNLLRESSINSQLAAIIEYTDDAVLTIALDGSVITWNPASELMYGYLQSEIVGTSVAKLYPDDKHNEFHRVLEFLNKGKPLHLIETERKHKNGYLVPVSISISPIKDADGKVIAGCSIERDISEWKKMETMKNEFVSIVSHELRTPVTAICGALSILENNLANLPKEKTETLFAIAYNNSERLINLINDILDIERLESGKMKFSLKVLNVEELVKRAIQTNYTLGIKFGNNIVLSESVKNVNIDVDPDRFIQALSNLISNAIKFSFPSKDVKIKIQTIDKSIVRISVFNEGEPIPKEFKNKIFQKFSRADNTSTRTTGGTGLGLSITKAIIEELDGSISYQSTAAGTTFNLDLPVVPSNKDRKHIEMDSLTVS